MRATENALCSLPIDDESSRQSGKGRDAGERDDKVTSSDQDAMKAYRAVMICSDF